MTSLFRRSSNKGSESSASRDVGGSANRQLNNNRPNRPVRHLEFNQAMEDFKTMFPSMDYEVIESVLRSNKGAVDATIDQLLIMSIEGHYSDDSSDTDDGISSEILELTQEPDSSDEEPPPVYSPPKFSEHSDCKYHEMHVSSPRLGTHVQKDEQRVRIYKNWNPPMLGNLPEDFLRILPRKIDSLKQYSQSSPSLPSSTSSVSVSSTSQWTAQSGSLFGATLTTGDPDLTSGFQESTLKQYLEDERIALFLQNSEFLKELKRNHEFLVALERDRLKYESMSSYVSSMKNSIGDKYPADSLEPPSDDALFRDKLKHMGKSTRKKLFEIARTFSERAKRRKSKRKTLIQLLGTANSTANLLEDVEGNPSEEDGQPRRAMLQEDNKKLDKLI